MSKFYTAEDGELIVPVMTGYKIMCCDCGLVHRLDFEVVDGQVQFRAYRDNRSTGQTRRHRNISVKHEKGESCKK